MVVCVYMVLNYPVNWSDKHLLCLHVLHQVRTAEPHDASDCRVFAKRNARYIGMLQPHSSPCATELACSSQHSSGSSESAPCEGENLSPCFVVLLRAEKIWSVRDGQNSAVLVQIIEIIMKQMKFEAKFIMQNCILPT